MKKLRLLRSRRLLGAAAILLIIAIVLAYRARWTSPPGLTPPSFITLDGELLTSAEHDARVAQFDWPYVLHLESNGGAGLLYFGSWHTNDADDPQIAAIADAFESFGPSIVLVESRMGFFVGPMSAGIGMFGEPAAAYALARRAGVPVHTLEPTFEAEVNALLERWSADRVAMFYTLRGYLGERRGGGDVDADALASHLLRKRTKLPALEGALPTLADLDALWQRDFPGAIDWRQMPEEMMWPGRDDSYLNEMATAGSRYRDEHMVRAIVDLARRGERVFAVCGGSHVIMQEPVLVASLADATRGSHSSPRPWESP